MGGSNPLGAASRNRGRFGRNGGYMGAQEGEAMHWAMMATEQRIHMRLVPDRVSRWDFSGWDYKSYAD